MQKNEIINVFIKVRNYKKYLEIGVGGGVNYNSIICEYKTNVDPCFDNKDSQDRRYIVNVMTSDQFFEKNEEKFDIILIDGLHTYEQVYKDIKNSLNCLNEDGLIICHDMLPPSEWHQRPPEEFFRGQEWNGTCWKALARLRVEEKDLKIYAIDTDCGLGIIQKEKGGNTPPAVSLEEAITYSYYEKNKKQLMNVISVNEWAAEMYNEKLKENKKIVMRNQKS
jgi:hypothetical protein